MIDVWILAHPVLFNRWISQLPYIREAIFKKLLIVTPAILKFCIKERNLAEALDSLSPKIWSCWSKGRRRAGRQSDQIPCKQISISFIVILYRTISLLSLQSDQYTKRMRHVSVQHCRRKWKTLGWLIMTSNSIPWSLAISHQYYSRRVIAPDCIFLLLFFNEDKVFVTDLWYFYVIWSSNQK